jgi:SAM-dependent methyltransferase
LLLGDSRSWACSQASGQVLEVAIGTGRNLPFYPRGIQLTGIDFSPAMLDIARDDRAAELGIDVTLIEADAQHLPFADDRFDTVVARWPSAVSLTPQQQSTRCTVCFALVASFWCSGMSQAPTES